MPEPLVSVVMPVKNSEKYLREALESLGAQTWRRYEVIAVDGASADRTAEIVRRAGPLFPAPARFVQQEGPGLGGARNTGIAMAQGELIAFLDYDDKWDAHKLELQVRRLGEDPPMDIALGWVRFFQEPGTTLRPGYRPEAFTVGQTGYTPGAMVARRTLFETVGVFDPELVIGCDSEWFARVLDRKAALAVVPESLLYKRVHEENLSAGVDRYRKEMLELLRRSVRRKRAAGPGPVDVGGAGGP